MNDEILSITKLSREDEGIYKAKEIKEFLKDCERQVNDNDTYTIIFIRNTKEGQDLSTISNARVTETIKTIKALKELSQDINKKLTDAVSKELTK